MARKLTVFIAQSLDGFIAGENDSLDFLSLVAREGEDYGYSSFLSEVDEVIIGRRTYDWVVAHAGYFPHAHLRTWVITRGSDEARGLTRWYNGDPVELVRSRKEGDGGTIFCDGGAQLVNTLEDAGLVDEWIISVIPCLLGKGIRLFNEARAGRELECIGSRAYPSGLVQLHYRRREH